MDRPNVHINLRLPQRDHEQIQREAERSCRSVQKEILYRLRQSLIEPAKTEASA
jgi:Arc-like DNA binding domain